MRKIGTIENHYHIYMNDKKKIVIKFESENHTISINDVKWFDENSEETLNFVADLILDDVIIGRCSNAGRGGNADYYLNSAKDYSLANVISQEVEIMENYCFPKINENFRDVLDKLANLNVSFIENKVKTIKHAIAVINSFQKLSDEWRKRYTNK